MQLFQLKKKKMPSLISWWKGDERTTASAASFQLNKMLQVDLSRPTLRCDFERVVVAGYVTSRYAFAAFGCDFGSIVSRRLFGWRPVPILFVSNTFVSMLVPSALISYTNVWYRCMYCAHARAALIVWVSMPPPRSNDETVASTDDTTNNPHCWPLWMP